MRCVVRSVYSLALAGLPAAVGACATGRFELIYCEDGRARFVECDCAVAPREARSGPLVPTGAPDGANLVGSGLRFVVRDHWLVIRVYSGNPRPTSLQAWLACGDALIPGEVAGRGVERDPSGTHEHEFLARFAGAPASARATDCTMHVVFADENGRSLTRLEDRVMLADLVQGGTPVEGVAWSVVVPEDGAARRQASEVSPSPRRCADPAR